MKYVENSMKQLIKLEITALNDFIKVIEELSNEMDSDIGSTIDLRTLYEDTIQYKEELKTYL